MFVTLIIKKHFHIHLPDQFLNQVKLNQVNFIITIGVIITNSSIITIIVFLNIIKNLTLSLLLPLLLVFLF